MSEINTENNFSESAENTFGDEIEDFADKEAKLKAAAEPSTVVPITPPRAAPVSSGPRVGIDKGRLHKEVQKLNVHTKKDPKSKKVKFHTLAVYIITEMALLDEEWQQCSFEIAAQESLNDGDEDVIDKLEVRMCEINGAVDSLFQQGRHFGVPKDFLMQYIPNINADTEELYAVDQAMAVSRAMVR